MSLMNAAKAAPAEAPTSAIKQAPEAAVKEVPKPAEAPAPESAPATPPAEPEKAAASAPDVSKELALIHKERKRIKELERAYQERTKKLEEYEQKMAKAKEDPYSVLDAHGLTVDELIQRKLKEGEPPSLEEKVKSVEERLREWEKSEKEKKEQAIREAEQKRINDEIGAFRNSVMEAVKANPEQYELIAADEAYDTVMQIALEAVQEDPEAYPTRADAEKLIPKLLGMVEDQLWEEKQKRYATSKKLKKLYGITEPTEKKAEDTAPKSEAKDTSSPQSASLTNRLVAPEKPETPGRLLSAEESKRLLAAKLQAQWDAQKR